MIVAGIATIPSRIEQVKRTIESLLPQVDRVCVSLNGFNPTPSMLMALVTNGPKIDASFTEGSDEQKFRALDSHYANDISLFLTCDDDLIYPPDYVSTITKALEKHDIVTFHGRSFINFPIISYYRDKGSKYRCLDKVASDAVVHVGGTGCMAFKPVNFSITLEDFPSKYMADVHVAVKARKEGKKIVCLKHEAGWIKYQPVANTIYDRFKNEDFEQTERVNAMFAMTDVKITV